MAQPESDQLEDLTANTVLGLENESNPNAEPNSSPTPADGDALDKLLDGHAPTGADPDADQPTADEMKPLADLVSKKPADAPKPAVEPAKEPAKDEPKADAKPANDPKPKGEWKDAGLPTWAADSTKEAFAIVKKGAQAQIELLQKDLTEARNKVVEFEQKVSKVPPDVEAKLARLTELEREQKLTSIEKDPEFIEKFDKVVERNTESVYSKLNAFPGGPETVKKIRELGGLDKVDLSATLDRLPLAARRFIEMKLVENESLADNRATELGRVKGDAEKYFKERETKTQADRESRDKRALELVNSSVGGQPWMSKQTVPVDATPEIRAQVESGNAFVDKARGLVADVLAAEDTPEVRAELATAAVLAHHFKAQLDALNRQVETLKKDSEELAKVKKASSTSRARTSVTPSAAPAPRNQSSPFSVVGQTPESHLDRLLDEVESRRE